MLGFASNGRRMMIRDVTCILTFRMADPKSADPSALPLPELDTSTWKGWADSILVWAATDPYDFLFKVLLCLSPLFFISSVLSFKLAKAIDREKQEKEKKEKMLASIAKKKSKKAD